MSRHSVAIAEARIGSYAPSDNRRNASSTFER
jgi:hypothetical protein